MMEKYCLVPHFKGLGVHFCTPKRCDYYPENSSVLVECPELVTELLYSKCIHNYSSGITEWVPPINKCSPAVLFGSKFMGSLVALRDFESNFSNDRQSSSRLQQRPFVSFAVGMSILSMLLVFSVCLAVCQNSSNQAALERTRRRRQRNSRRVPRTQSVGVQARVHSSQQSGTNLVYPDREALILNTETITCLDNTSVGVTNCLESRISDNDQNESTDTLRESNFQNILRSLPFRRIAWLPTYDDAIKAGIYSIVGSLNYSPLYVGSDVSSMLNDASHSPSPTTNGEQIEVLSAEHLCQVAISQPLSCSPSSSTRDSTSLTDSTQDYDTIS